MTAIQHAATVHERTVQRVAAGDIPRPSRRRAAPRTRATRVRSIQVDPRVMDVARRLAKGDMSRVVIRSATEVIVTNPRR